LILEQQTVYLNISGSSMSPFLIHQRDAVRLQKPDHPPIPGDIVLYQRENGQFILHRICRMKNGFYYLAGDNQTILEGPVPPEQILAVVTAVCRKGQWFEAEDPRWQFFAIFWRRILCLRPLFIWMYTELTRQR